MKTNPTIHALALQFTELHEGSTAAYHHAKDVLTWLFEKPLSDRLTTEAREKIKAIYFRSVYSAEDIRQNLTEKYLIDALFGEKLFT